MWRTGSVLASDGHPPTHQPTHPCLQKGEDQYLAVGLRISARGLKMLVSDSHPPVVVQYRVLLVCA